MACKITADQIAALCPCPEYAYDSARIKQLMGGSEIAIGAALPVLLALPRPDGRQVVSRLLDRRDRVAWACDCAERVVDRITDPWIKETALAAIQTARAWVEGEADDDAAAAASAAAAFPSTAYAAAAAYASTAAKLAASAYASAADACACAAFSADAAHASAYASARFASNYSVHAYASVSTASASANADEYEWQIAQALQYLERSTT